MMSIYPLGRQASRRKTTTMESEARVQTIHVGCLGLGNMGSGIAENILRAGFEVAAFDIRPQARNRLSQLGAKAAQSPAEAARDAALTTASAEMTFISGISLAATFEGEFSQVTRSYAGKGVMRYTW